MTIYFIGAGPGDPDLLTVKARRCLVTCRLCIYAGSLVSPEVLALLPKHAERHDSAALTLDEIIALFERAHRDRVDAVRLHTGDPTIFSAIAEQTAALRQRGIEYEVVPGISAFQAAAAILRAELTAPEIAQTVILGRAAGRTPVPDVQSLERLAETRGTLCLFLSAHKTREVTARLIPILGEACPAAAVYHASRPEQMVIEARLADLADRVEAAGICRTAILIVGEALRGEAGPSKLYDPSFGHGYRSSTS